MVQHPSSAPGWRDIPRKGELAVICSVRIVDFFQQAALQAVMFYQLQSFAPDATEKQISFRAGLLQGAFTIAQVPSSIYWGRVADSHGRKFVILVSLLGQGVSCLGVAFATSFFSAMVWRVLAGVINATVGGARTALAEKTEKKYHSRTFLLLPLAWNLANIVGPPMAGALSDPVQYHPSWFGKNSLFGGLSGVAWMVRWPYAPPSILCALLLFADALLVFLVLEETLESRRGRRDRGLELAEGIRHFLAAKLFRSVGYTRLGQQTELGFASETESCEPSSSTPMIELDKHKNEAGLPQHVQDSQGVRSRPQIFTRSVCLVLATVAGLDFQLAGFTALWSMFLASERGSSNDDRHVLNFTGGLGFPPAVVGLALSVLGWAGIVFQLSLYPRINARLGLLRSTVYSLFLFPIPYAMAPWLSRMTWTDLLLWPGILIVGSLVIVARTFAIPGIVLLTNNAAPSPEVLGTIHGLGAAVSSAFKTVGPIVAGKWYSQGLSDHVIGLAWPWWMLSFSALIAGLPVLFVKDG